MRGHSEQSTETQTQPPLITLVTCPWKRPTGGQRDTLLPAEKCGRQRSGRRDPRQGGRPGGARAAGLRRAEALPGGPALSLSPPPPARRDTPLAAWRRDDKCNRAGEEEEEGSRANASEAVPDRDAGRPTAAPYLHGGGEGSAARSVLPAIDPKG